MEADMGKIEAQLEVWDARIEELAAKAGKARNHVRVDLHYRVDDLKARRAFAQAKLDELRAAGDGEREGFEAAFKIAWNDLEIAFRNLGLRP